MNAFMIREDILFFTNFKITLKWLSFLVPDFYIVFFQKELVFKEEEEV
jgi:hypothetical protein